MTLTADAVRALSDERLLSLLAQYDAALDFGGRARDVARAANARRIIEAELKRRKEAACGTTPKP